MALTVVGCEEISGRGGVMDKPGFVLGRSRPFIFSSLWGTVGKISPGKEERHTLPSGREIIAQAAGLLKMEFSFFTAPGKSFHLWAPGRLFRTTSLAAVAWRTKCSTNVWLHFSFFPGLLVIEFKEWSGINPCLLTFLHSWVFFFRLIFSPKFGKINYRRWPWGTLFRNKRYCPCSFLFLKGSALLATVTEWRDMLTPETIRLPSFRFVSWSH